jgi:amidase/aspartyl-tRNA(Asn)/glutamyl-tRNA(Gln) amidotransferase subunit A
MAEKKDAIVRFLGLFSLGLGAAQVLVPSRVSSLIGLKPTAGVVPRRPIPDWIDFSTDGPMATSASDLRLLLSVMAGPEPGDPTALPRWEPGPSRRSDRLLAATRMTPGGPLPAEVEERFHSALASLEEALSLEAEMLVPEEPLWSGDPDADWFVIATTEHVNRLGRAWVGEHLHEMHPAASAFLRQGLGISIDAYLDARRRRFDHVRDLDLLLDGNTVLASPTMAAAGFLADGRLKPDDEVGALPSSVYNTAAQNMTGHPAISLPAGRMGNGVPFGLQVTAPRFRDDLLLDLAGLWEQAHPWPRVAPDYEPFESALGLE